MRFFDEIVDLKGHFKNKIQIGRNKEKAIKWKFISYI